MYPIWDEMEDMKWNGGYEMIWNINKWQISLCALWFIFFLPLFLLCSLSFVVSDPCRNCNLWQFFETWVLCSFFQKAVVFTSVRFLNRFKSISACVFSVLGSWVISRANFAWSPAYTCINRLSGETCYLHHQRND